MQITSDILAINVGLYHAPSKSLIFSDIHLGYESELRKKGILVPQFQFNDSARVIKGILAELKQQKHEVKQLVLNGDLKHSFGAISQQEWNEVLGLIDGLHALGLKIVFVRGNHDTILDPVLAKRAVASVPLFRIDDVLILHGDEEPLTKELNGIKTILIGHEHSAITLRDKAKAERFKCYLRGRYKKKTLLVQPSLFPLVQGTDVLRGELLSPLLKKGVDDFTVFVVDEKTNDVLEFGRLAELRTEP